MRVLLMLSVIVTLSANGSRLPDAVGPGVIARGPQRTAYVAWTLDSRLGEGLLTEHFVTQVSSDTVYEVNYGDASGFHPRRFEEVKKFLSEVHPVGQTVEMHRFKYAEAQHRLLEGGRVWSKAGSGHFADLRDVGTPGTEPPLDVLVLGIWPVPRASARLSGVPRDWSHGWGSAAYTTTTSVTLESVTATRDELSITWELDVQRGRQPVRVLLSRGGEPLYWSATQLREQDGRWVPSATEFFSARQGNGREPYATYKIHEASFDKPWHWQDPFTPNDLDIGLGMQLTGDRFWDGTQLISREEYMDLIHLYGIPEHPDVVAKHAEFMNKSIQEYHAFMEEARKHYLVRYEKEHGHPFEPPKIVADAEGPWDIFVREFIASHDLCDKRKEHALSVLERCKKLRASYLHKHRKAIDEAERKKAEDHLVRLNKPVQLIFERMLKPGLLRLLTRAERAELTRR